MRSDKWDEDEKNNPDLIQFRGDHQHKFVNGVCTVCDKTIDDLKKESYRD